MTLTNEFQPIRDWAKERGIYANGDPKTQTIKLGEEFGELCKAIIEGNSNEAADAIGDITVVLVSVAELMGFNFEICVNGAYDVIKNRKGKMQDGTFIKAEGDKHTENIGDEVKS